MNRLESVVGCCACILVLTPLGGSAHADARGGGFGLFVLGEELTAGVSGFRFFGRPMASHGAI